MHIFTEYSLWFFPICLAIGLALAFFLYHKDKKLTDAPLWVRRLLFGLRAFVCTILLFLLLGPYVELLHRTIEKPTIVLLHDNSQSIVLTKDSSMYKTSYKSDYEKFVNDLEQNFSVDEYTFDAELSDKKDLTFDGNATNIASVLQDVSTRYYKQNIGTVVLASDGIYNMGENPKYATSAFPPSMPIYTIALGDTIQNCDNLISNVLHNRIVFRDNPFSIKISIESHALQGKHSKIIIQENEQTVFETSIIANNEHFYKTIDCKLKASEIGRKIYTVHIEHHDGEISEQNNTFTFAVDVLESKQKIRIVYDALHPDVAAIRRAIESNKNYDCDVVCLSDNKSFSIQDCNCLVLIGLPNSYGKGKTILSDALQAGIPSLVIYNQAMSLDVFNAQNCGLQISNFRNSFDEAKPNYENDFSQFLIDDASKSLLSQVPPLQVPFGSYSIGSLSKILCTQTIGTVEVERPLIFFSQVQNTKIGVICGEGLWRWRLYDKKINDSFDAFDSFVNKIIAYLALTEKRELFSVNSESIYTENQNVTFTAELYDKTFEPMANQDLSLVITNENGKEFPFSFSPNDQFYVLHAGKFSQGNYTYKATAKLSDSELSKIGSFSVLPMQIEALQTKANHGVLNDLSMQSGGVMVYPNDLESLKKIIFENKNIVAVSHIEKKRNLALDLPIILIIILLSASVEWFLRKFYATY